MSYTSSIINKYGDTDNVKKDAKVLKDIFDRQGVTFLLDSIAERIGVYCLHYNTEQKREVINNVVNELKSALDERT